MLESAPKQLPYYPPIGRGLTSTVREFGSDEVLKEIQSKRRHTYEPIEISPEEKERLAESIVVAISWLRESLGELIPETRLAGPGFIRQTKIVGTSAAQQGFFKRMWAYFRLRRAVQKAVRALTVAALRQLHPTGGHIGSTAAKETFGSTNRIASIARRMPRPVSAATKRRAHAPRAQFIKRSAATRRQSERCETTGRDRHRRGGKTKWFER